ncbi:MAG: hypothetical protein VX454_07685 [Pseudomonadota bacterium]|nr:hypothetical protein [Pseudomonadota bacterium]
MTNTETSFKLHSISRAASEAVAGLLAVLEGHVPQVPDEDHFTIVQGGHGMDMLQFELQVTTSYAQRFWLPVPQTVEVVQASIETLREPIQDIINDRDDREKELSALRSAFSTMTRISVEVVDVAFAPLPSEEGYESSKFEITCVIPFNDRMRPYRSVVRASSSDEAIERLQSRALLDEELGEKEAGFLESGAAGSIDKSLLERIYREASDPERTLRLILSSDTTLVECKNGLPNFQLNWDRGVVKADDPVMLDLLGRAMVE